MSDYRVFDKTKNQYDATVMSSLFVDETPKGFDVNIKRYGNTTDEENNIITTLVEITFSTFRQNPTGGVYVANADYTITNPISGYDKALFRGYFQIDTPIFGTPSDITQILRVSIKNETDFNLKLYNVVEEKTFHAGGPHSVENGMSGGSIDINLIYDEGKTPDDFTLVREYSAHSETTIEIKETTKVVEGSSITDNGDFYYYSLNQFSLQRIS